MDAGIVRIDAVTIDAGVVVRGGEIVVEVVGAWCDLEIDGEARGRWKRGSRYEVTAGEHVVRCYQGATGNEAAERVVVAGGEAKVVKLALQAPVDVRLDVSTGAARVDGVKRANGASFRIAPQRHHVELLDGGKVVDDRWIDVKRACTIRDLPELACY